MLPPMKALPLLATAAALALTACGYTPMYAPTSGDPARGQVIVGSVIAANPSIQAGERRTVQEVTRELHRYFPAKNPNYDVLDISVLEEQSTLAVQRTATVARAQVVLSGRITLTDTEGNRLLDTSVSSRAAYNVEENPFSTESGRRYARLTAAKTLAEEISRRVVLFYRQDATGTSESSRESAK